MYSSIKQTGEEIDVINAARSTIIIQKIQQFDIEQILGFVKINGCDCILNNLEKDELLCFYAALKIYQDVLSDQLKNMYLSLSLCTDQDELDIVERISISEDLLEKINLIL